MRRLLAQSSIISIHTFPTPNENVWLNLRYMVRMEVQVKQADMAHPTSATQAVWLLSEAPVLQIQRRRTSPTRAHANTTRPMFDHGPASMQHKPGPTQFVLCTPKPMSSRANHVLIIICCSPSCTHFAPQPFHRQSSLLSAIYVSEMSPFA